MQILGQSVSLDEQASSALFTIAPSRGSMWPTPTLPMTKSQGATVLFYLLLAFTVIPLLELMLLVKLYHVTNLTTTFSIVLVTGILGSLLARWQGSLAWQRFFAAINDGRTPASEAQDGLLIFFAAGLLLTPGLITDALGFFLLLPLGRRLVRKWLSYRFKGAFVVTTTGFNSSSSQRFDDENVIDATHVSVHTADSNDQAYLP